MFLNTVPIEQHESARFVHDFPRANREGVMQTWDDVKRQLGRAGAQGFTYVDLLSDFHLLFFLTTFLDMVRTLSLFSDRQGGGDKVCWWGGGEGGWAGGGGDHQEWGSGDEGGYGVSRHCLT